MRSPRHFDFRERLLLLCSCTVPPKTVNLERSGTGNPAGVATGGVHLFYGSWPSLVMYDELYLELSYRALWHLKLE